MRLFLKKETLTCLILLAVSGLSAGAWAHVDPCQKVRLKCVSENCPIPSFTLEKVHGHFYLSDTIARRVGTNFLKLPYSISFEKNGDDGLVGAGSIDADYKEGADVVKNCSFSIPFFSITKKGEGLYHASYNLPQSMPSKIFIQDRQQSHEVDTHSSTYVERGASIAVVLGGGSSLAGGAGYGAGDSHDRREDSRDARQFQEYLCPSPSDHLDEVSLNVEYLAENLAGCDLNTVVPTAFPYDLM